MRECVNVLLCVCTCVCVFTCVCLCVLLFSLCVHVCVFCVCTFVCVCVCVCVCFVYVCMCVFCVCVWVCMCTHLYLTTIVFQNISAFSTILSTNIFSIVIHKIIHILHFYSLHVWNTPNTCTYIHTIHK